MSETEASSIEELLSHDGEDVARRAGSRRPAGVRLMSLLLLSAMWAAASLAVLHLSHLSVPLATVIAGAVSVTLVGRWTRSLRPPSMRNLGRHQHERHSGAGDGLRAAVRRWETLFENSESDGDRFARRVLPRLAELADERLRQRHGLTRATDPQRARVLLGEPLWEYLSASGRRRPQRRELEMMLDALEKL